MPLYNYESTVIDLHFVSLMEHMHGSLKIRGVDLVHPDPWNMIITNA